jgi:hypothetical protein
MSRTPARITQADVARVIRAARQAGASRVRVFADGVMEIDLISPTEGKIKKTVEPEREIVL